MRVNVGVNTGEPFDLGVRKCPSAGAFACRDDASKKRFDTPGLYRFIQKDVLLSGPTVESALSGEALPWLLSLPAAEHLR